MKLKNIDSVKRQLNAMRPRHKGITIYAGAINNTKYPDSDMTINEVALLNELGHINTVEKKNGETVVVVTPPRPVYRPLQESRGSYWEKRFFDLYESGKSIEDACVSLMGEMVGEVKEAMINLDTPPNAKSTIRSKGFNNPLINTRWLLTHISGEIEYRSVLGTLKTFAKNFFSR